MKFKLEFFIDNDDFKSDIDYQIFKIFNDLACKAEYKSKGENILDIHDNIIGQWEIIDGGTNDTITG